MNLYDVPLMPFSAELVAVLHENQAMRVEKIISCGQTTDWYDQSENELVFLLQGEATLEFEHSTKQIKAGEQVYLPQHVRHRVIFTSCQPVCIWLCIFEKEK